MALIKEPIEVDFFVEPIPLSDTERTAISAYIKNYKQQKAASKQKKVVAKKKKSGVIS